MYNIDAYTKKRDQSIASLKETFGTLRAGRVSAALLDNVKVDLYGERSPIKYGATISVLSPTDLQVRPFDVTTLKGMVGGINKADLGCTVTQNGNAIILKFPAPSEERRQDLIRQAKKCAEEGKVAVRNIRRDANNDIKKDKELSEDRRDNRLEDIQKATDKHIEEIEKLLANKVKDIETI